MSGAKIPITALVQTKNEEAGIARCVRALAAFEEVIVVDSFSTDRTKEIAEAEGARIHLFRWDGGYPKKKQWQLEHLAEMGVRHEWVMFVDADERPTPKLIEFLRHFLQSVPDEVAAVEVGLLNRFAGRFLKHGHRIRKTCVLRRGRVRFPEQDDLGAPGMGELEGHYQPVCDGVVAEAEGLLIHDDPDPISTWFERHNRYSDWEVWLDQTGRKQAVDENRSHQGKLFAKVPFKPAVFFAYSFIARGGFLDGRAGLSWALAYAFYYWMIDVKIAEAESLRRDGRRSTL